MRLPGVEVPGPVSAARAISHINAFQKRKWLSGLQTMP